MEAKEIADTTFQVVSCCCEPAKDCADHNKRCGKGVHFVFLVMSLVFGIFDTVTDWIAWASLKSDNYGLVEASDALVYTWLGFTIIGTVLLIISLITDVMYLFFDIQIGGWNSLTVSEFQSFLNLVLEDLPILTLTCVYFVFRHSCHIFDPSFNIQRYASTSTDLFVSGVITYAAILYRTFRTCFRICYSSGRCCGCCCECCCPGLPKYEKLCQPKSCARYICVVPYACLIVLQTIFVIFALLGVIFAAITFSSVFSGEILVNPGSLRGINWNITRSYTVTTGNNITSLNATSNNVTVFSDTVTTSNIITVLSDTEPLVTNGSLFATEAFHRNVNMTTYCLAYFELHRKKFIFNVAHINNQHSDQNSCVCHPGSTPCDRYYENLMITANFERSYHRDVVHSIEEYKGVWFCPFPLKSLQRDRNLQVNCNCNFSNTVEHWVA